MRIFGICFAGFLMLSSFHFNSACQEHSLPSWTVHWYEMQAPGKFGRHIGTAYFPFSFFYDWGYGNVYNLYDNHIGFKAFLELELSIPIALDLEVGADDGVLLYIDGNVVLDAWELGSYRKFRTLYPLTAGKHRLELHYFEWRGVAKVKFAVDVGVLLVFWSLNSKVKSLTETLLRVQTAIEAMTKQLLEQRSNVEDVVKELQKFAAIQAEVETLVERIETLEQQMYATTQQFSQQAELLESVEEKLSSIEVVISDLKGAITGLTQTIQEAINILRQETRSVSQNVLKLSGALEALEKSLNSIESKISDLESVTQTVVQELILPRDSWKVYWYEMNEPGVFGQRLGTSFFPLNFFFNWGYGQIFQNRCDRVGFKAYAKIYLPKDTFCRFKVFANNCFVLYIDGAKAVEHWGIGEALPPEEKLVEIFLKAGEHNLELHYYEWDGEAWISLHQW